MPGFFFLKFLKTFSPRSTPSFAHLRVKVAERVVRISPVGQAPCHWQNPGSRPSAAAKEPGVAIPRRFACFMKSLQAFFTHIFCLAWLLQVSLEN
jgi:hypothetical protein